MPLGRHPRQIRFIHDARSQPPDRIDGAFLRDGLSAARPEHGCLGRYGISGNIIHHRGSRASHSIRSRSLRDHRFLSPRFVVLQPRVLRMGSMPLGRHARPIRFLHDACAHPSDRIDGAFLRDGLSAARPEQDALGDTATADLSFSTDIGPLLFADLALTDLSIGFAEVFMVHQPAGLEPNPVWLERFARPRHSVRNGPTINHTVDVDGLSIRNDHSMVGRGRGHLRQNRGQRHLFLCFSADPSGLSGFQETVAQGFPSRAELSQSIQRRNGLLGGDPGSGTARIRVVQPAGSEAQARIPGHGQDRDAWSSDGGEKRAGAFSAAACICFRSGSRDDRGKPRWA